VTVAFLSAGGFWAWFAGAVAMLSVWCRTTGLLQARLGQPEPEPVDPAVAADILRAEAERQRYWESVGGLPPSERYGLIRRSNEKQELRARVAIRFLGPDPLVRRIGLDDAQVGELVGLIQAELGPVRPETIRYFLERLDVVVRYVEWQQTGHTGDLTRLRRVIHGDE
jgi:DNA-binding transcriptional MerR regulator